MRTLSDDDLDRIATGLKDDHDNAIQSIQSGLFFTGLIVFVAIFVWALVVA